MAEEIQQEEKPLFYRFKKSPWLAFTIAGILVLLAILYRVIFDGGSTAMNAKGIVYPISGQNISGREFSLYSTFPLDQVALGEALMKDSEKAVIEKIDYFPLASGAAKYVVHISLAKGDLLSVDKNIYNQLKTNSETTVYEDLPATVSWEFSETDSIIDSVAETEQSELTRPEFELSFSGDLSRQELLVFSIGLKKQPQAPEEGKGSYYYGYSACQYTNLENEMLDWSRVKSLSVDIRERKDNKIIFLAGNDWTRDDSCLFVALKSDADSATAFYANEYEKAEAKLSVQELFNPDQDFKSIFAIEFTTPLFDTKKKRKPAEEIAYRLEKKRELAKLIQVSPAAEITPEDITLYAEKALIPILLKEKTSYVVTLNRGQDVYGEEYEKQTVSVPTGELKYLGLRQRETQTVFMNYPSVYALHYGVSDPTVRLCRIGLEEYAKIEHIVSRRSQYDFSEKFLLEGIDSLASVFCEDSKIVLQEKSIETPIELSALLGATPAPGLYYMTFAFQGERKVSPESPANNPLFFAIVDTHITMKLSKNGKSFFWVNDLRTGDGVPGQTLNGYQNIFVSSEGSWDDRSNKYNEKFFNPLEKKIYSDAITLGVTGADGILETNLKSEDYYNAFSSWYEDPQHRSILVVAADGKHLSYVVSKWNSGIADWNFGFQPEQYDPSGNYSAHLYTDRKLYSPGETVHFKAIVRSNAKTLEIPAGKKFTLILRDPSYQTITEKNITLNEFGSYTEDVEVAADARLGIFRYELKTTENEEVEMIRGAEFSVEEFKKPTFKVEVSVSSPTLQDNTFTDPGITEEKTPWGYSYKTYQKDLTLDADIHAAYYSGGLVSNAPFTYTVFKQYYYESSYWDECFYGCFWEPYKEYYSEGSGVLDGSGAASISLPISHQTTWSDYRYLVEVTVTDPGSQAVSGSGSVIVKVPEGLRQNDPYVRVELDTDNKFVAEGGKVLLSIKPERRWDKANNDRYKVVLKHREYTTKHTKQTGGDILPQVDFEDEVVEEVSVNTSKFDLGKEGILTRSFRLAKDGEYILTLEENDPENSFAVHTLKLYAYSPTGITNTPVVSDNKIAVLAEKTSYHLGDTAKMLVRLPFSAGKALITIEKKNVVSHEVIDLSGNTLIKEYKVDDTFIPNAYISVIAFKPGSEAQPEYKVGYTEIVVDKTDKKLFLDTKTGETYSPRDTVSLELSAKDRAGKPVRSELSVAVIDEALIAILGNIDVDILPKFFQKIIFQTHTALTNVAMLKQLYFARKGIVGGSGGKDGGDSIFTRVDFKNTAFYAGSVVTNDDGTAFLDFKLPDNIGDFRIITIGHSKNNFFGSTEKTISVRQEITVEETFPLIVRVGDEMRIGATVFNNSKQEKTVFVSLDSEELTTPDNNRQDVSIKAGERSFVTWHVRVPSTRRLETVTYTITASDENNRGDRIQKAAPVAIAPLIANRLHYQDDFQVSLEKTMDLMPEISPEQTKIEFSVSTTLLAGIEKIVVSLLQYPYGCIEQTISSTLPNAIVKKFQDLFDLGIDQATLQKNLQAGIKRFASMQTADGGFAYWEGSQTSEPHITPYVVMALAQMRDLGVDVPADMISRGKEFIENQVKSLSGNIDGQRLSQLVHELHALSRLDSGVFGTARTLIKNRVSELTTHERIVYALALAKKDMPNYRIEIDEHIAAIDISKAVGNDRNWYWDATADKALFTQLLILAQPDHKDIPKLIKELYALDMGGYYFSTQAKIQSFIAFTQYLESAGVNKPDLTIDYQLGSERGKIHFNKQNIFKKITRNFSDVRVSNEKLTFTAKSSGNIPVYVDLVIYQIPTDPATISAQQDKGVSVERQYFKLGEVKEVSDEWSSTPRDDALGLGLEEWKRSERDLAPVSGSTFKVGETYMVKITTDFVDPQRMVALESYLPAGFKSLNPRFQTEKTQINEGHWSWPFYHQEFRADRFFASADQVGNEPNTLIYYVRAIVPGQFLEPPVSVFPMYRPEIEGHTAFRQITIEE